MYKVTAKFNYGPRKRLHEASYLFEDKRSAWTYAMRLWAIAPHPFHGLYRFILKVEQNDETLWLASVQF